MTDQTASAEKIFPPPAFRSLFISDFHMGSEKTAATHLYEFLKDVDYAQLKDLYLVGDVIGGWENINKEQRPFPEMEKRVFDVINYAVGQGVNVHFIPGNHDEKLRGILDKLQNRRRFTLFPRNVAFENQLTFETGGADSKKFKVWHGDQYDPALFNKKWFKPIALLTSAIYDGIEILDKGFAALTRRIAGREIHFAKKIAQGFSSFVDFFVADNDKRVKDLEQGGFDGIVMGHTHIMEQKTAIRNGKTYYLVNCGDWVENATYAYTLKEGDIPTAVNYKLARLARGFCANPAGAEEKHAEKFMAMRGKTDMQLRLVQMFWPAHDRRKVIDLYNQSMREIRQERLQRVRLRVMARQLRQDGTIDAAMRAEIGQMMQEETCKAEKSQENNLHAIFNKYKDCQEMTKEDISHACRLISDFMKESRRKIVERAGDLGTSSRRLNFRGLLKARRKQPPAP